MRQPDETTGTKTGGLKNVQFEDALNMTGFGKYSYQALMVCGVCLLAMGMEMFGMSFLATASTCDLKITLSQRGILTAAPLLATVVTAYFWGYITDTRGRRAALIWSMGGGYFFSVVSSFSPNLTWFTVLKFMASAFATAANASTYTLLGEVLPKKHRDNMLMILTSCMMIISCTNGLISYGVLTYIDFNLPIPFLGISYVPWRLLCVLLATPMALSVVALLWINESPKYLISQGKSAEAMKVLMKIYAGNTGNNEESYPVESVIFTEETVKVDGDSVVRSLWRQFAPLFHKKYLKYTFCLFYIQFIVTAIANSISLWMPYVGNNFQLGLYEKDAFVKDFCSVVSDPDREVKETASGKCINTLTVLSFAIVIVFSLMNFLFNSIFVLVVKCVGKKIFLVGLLFFTGMCGIIMNWVNNPIAGMVLYVMFNFECLSLGLISAYAVQIYPTYLRGMSLCVLLMVGRIGGAIATNILGAVFESHCKVTFYSLAVAVLTTAFICIFLPNDAKNKNKVMPQDEITKL